MSIYKRNKTWWIQFYSPAGKRIQRSAKTQIKKDAQRLHDKLKHEAWLLGNLDEEPRRTWGEATERWLIESEHKRSLKDSKWIIKWLDKHLAGLYLDQINREKVISISLLRKKDGVENGTINRTMSVLRVILNCAVREWGWLQSAPFIKALKEPKIRVRWLTQEEASNLLAELPEHLHAMTVFSLATGLRESNVVNLEWEQVDLKRKCCWIYADQAKENKAIAVPLNASAVDVIHEQTGKNPRYVFTYQGNKVNRCNNQAWKKSLKRADIENFRWHDLRHTWASWHIQNGTPPHILQKLGGWKSLGMVNRYAHLSSKNLEDYAENSKGVTNSLHRQNTDDSDSD